MTDMTEKGSDFVKDLGDAARRNPISAALIGMGIVWLFAGKAAVRPSEFLERTGLLCRLDIGLAQTSARHRSASATMSGTAPAPSTPGPTTRTGRAAASSAAASSPIAAGSGA